MALPQYPAKSGPATPSSTSWTTPQRPSGLKPRGHKSRPVAGWLAAILTWVVLVGITWLIRVDVEQSHARDEPTAANRDVAARAAPPASPAPSVSPAPPASTTNATSPAVRRQQVSHDGISISPNGLAPELVRRLRLAQKHAAAAGIQISVTSGWRSLARQRRLYREEIATYGSAQLAKKWVLPPQESEHPRGRAIDIGPRKAGTWLQKHGYRYGLCRRYANEWWHFEPITTPGQPCPALARNAADSRLATK